MNTEKYLRIPYKWNGRDYDGCDCYGLIYLYFKDELGIMMLDFNNIYTSSNYSNSNIMLENAHIEWQSIDINEIQVNDVIVIKDDRLSTLHCGVMIDKYTMLHTSSIRGCCTTKISRINAKNIIGVYRYKGDRECG